MTARASGSGPLPSDPPLPADPPPATALEAMRWVSRVGREHATVLDRRFSVWGLTAQQAGLLLHAGSQPVGLSRLAELLETDTAGMTRLVDRLEAKGLLRRRRHGQDRRAVLVELTDQGRALLPRLPPVFGQVTRLLFDGFSVEETDTLTALCRRLHANLDRTDGGGPREPGAKAHNPPPAT
jgi:DNA-binding MarR family transcriptional regulator